MAKYFSIIIPTLNEEKNLPLLLESLAGQTFRDFEVIVCDGGSTDSTKEKANSFSAILPALNFHAYNVKNVSGARNKGAEMSNGTFCVFFDSDVKVENSFLEGIKKHLEKNQLDALTVWNRPDNKSFTNKIIFFLLNFSMTLFQKIKPVANGPCIIINKMLFDEIHGFDEQIVFGEDFDLIQRAHKEKARFAVFSKPYLYVSGRRFEKEGIISSLFKSLKAVAHQLILGPIRKPIFEYEMGGQYYKKN